MQVVLTSQRRRRKQLKTTYSQWLSSLFTRKGAERTGFLFAWKMTARSKDFKIKVYPSVGYLVVYVFIMFFNIHHFSLQSLQEESTQGRSIIIVALYMTSLLVLMALNQMIYSDKFKAAWIFYTAPVAFPGAVISGAVKSVILKFYMPIILVIALYRLCIDWNRILTQSLAGSTECDFCECTSYLFEF